MPTTTETDPDRPAPEPRDATPEPAELPAIDPDAYEVLGEIARGGMGRILRARDRRLDRIVAIKQLLVSSPKLAALFEREVRITARLQHPSIVSVYEAGALPGGELVYAMRLVPGRALRDVLREPRDLPERLGFLPMVIAVADALAYAHQQRVIHRDLKPGNVLVGEFGEVVVIDWGLARELDAPDDAAAAGGAMGTPAYMSPEAARGEPVDERADVYAIGAILYEALAGAPPYGGVSASEVRAAVRAGPPPPIEARARGVPADLAAIVAKAMARTPGDRYPSARELAEELRRFQTGQLVSAHAYSVAERAARWVRRNRAPVAVAAVALAVVAALAAIGVARIVRERDLAADRADRLTLAQARLESDRDPLAALRTLMTLPRRSPHWGAARVIAADALADGIAAAVPAAGDVVAVGLDATGPRVMTRVEAGLAVGDALVPLAGVPAAIAASARADTIAAVVDGELLVWRVGAAEPVLRRPATRADPRLALAADGSAVAVAGRDLGVRAWTVADGVEHLHDETARDVGLLAISGGARVIALGRGVRVELRGALARDLDLAGRVVALAVSGDGAAIAVATDDGAVRVEDVAGDAAVRLPHDAPARALALGDGAAWIATGADRVVRIWDRAGSLHHELRGHRGEVIALAVSADGDAVVSAEFAGARRWQLADGGATRLGGPRAAGLALAAGDGWLAAAGADGSVWRWAPGAAAAERLGAHAAAATTLAIGDAGLVVSGGDDRTVRAWTPDGARVLGAHGGAVRAVAIAPGGAVAASAGDDRVVRLWSLADGAEQVIGWHGAAVTALAFTAGRVVAIADEPVVRVWDPAGGAPRELALAAPATALAVAPGGAIAVGTRGGDVVHWPAAGVATVIARHRGPVRDLAFAPDGRAVASAGDDGRVIVARPGAAPRVLAGHDDFAVAVAFAPDGRTVASGGEDGAVRLWDVDSGEGRALAAGAWVADVVFADGGDAVIAIGADGVVRRWRDDLPRDAAALRAALAAILAASP